MVNYYAELGLDRGLGISELEQQLKALKRKWTTRASSASSTDKRQEAERMVALIKEASTTLLNKDSKAKYDRKLDKDPSGSQTAASSYESTAPIPDFSNTNAAFLDLMEQFYNSGNYNQALAVANKVFESGTATVDIYRLSSLCYIEQGDNNGAYRILGNMRSAFPNDEEASMVFAIFCIRLLPEHASEGQSCVVQLLKNGYQDNSTVAALDAECSLLSGDVPLAEKKVSDYLSRNNNDQSYRQDMCGAFSRYADSFMTNYGGDNYFDSQEAFDNWAKYTKRALELYPDSGLKKQYDDNVAVVGGKQFVTDNWLGIACCALYTLAFFPLGILLVAMIYFSIVPKWMIHRYNYTNKLVGVYEIFRIINYVLSIIIRVSWELVKLIFRIIFAFV